MRAIASQVNRFVGCHLHDLAEACFLAAEWQETSADAHEDCDPEMTARYRQNAAKYRRMEKTLRRYAANAKVSGGASPSAGPTC